MNFFTPRLGIDLGTANTLVFVPGKGVVIEEPTVVAVMEVSNKIVAIGKEAKDMIGKTPDSLIVYRPLKDGVIADHRVTEAMLRYFMNKALGKYSFMRMKPDVLISVPSGVTGTEKRAVIEAATKAGARRPHVIRESILAAMGAGIDINEPRGRMIIDIGGGTTDIAVISLAGIVCSSSIKCAGDKFDQAILSYIRKTYDLDIGDQTAEEVKMKIGSAIALPPQEELAMDVKGRDAVTGVPCHVRITSNDIVTALTPELQKIIKAIRGVLEQTPPELASDILDNGIILTGGGSLLRNIATLIEKKTGGVKTVLSDNPPYAVALGTGHALAHFDSYFRSLNNKKY